MQFDPERTHKNAVEYLKNKLVPVNYRTVYQECLEMTNAWYSEKTDPAEKFRQRYGNEQRDKEIVVIPKTGDLALRSWFPSGNQPYLIPPKVQSIIIQGECIISYEAGYDQGRREPYMMDHFNDANTDYRQKRRQRAKLAEYHVRHFFQSNYPRFFNEPSNHRAYEQPSKDDFILKFPAFGCKTYTIDVDVKTWSNDDRARIRNVSKNILYLICDWLPDNTVKMDGILWGSLLFDAGFSPHELVTIDSYHLKDISVLLVILNMAMQGKDYKIYRNLLSNNGQIAA